VEPCEAARETYSCNNSRCKRWEQATNTIRHTEVLITLGDLAVFYCRPLPQKPKRLIHRALILGTHIGCKEGAWGIHIRALASAQN